MTEQPPPRCKVIWEGLGKLRKYAQAYWNCRKIYKRVASDPNRLNYRDIAIIPAHEGEADELALFTETHGGTEAVDKIRKQEEIKRQALQQAAE